MPYAVTHILIVILIVSIFRDHYLKNKEKKSFHLHYVLIAGLGGVLPDIDIPISFILNFAGFQNWDIHRMFTHTLILPIALSALFLIFTLFNSKTQICDKDKHKLKLNLIFLMLAIGTLTHITLDFSLPYFIALFPTNLKDLIAPTLDGVLFVLWLGYLEIKHKISDFI